MDHISTSLKVKPLVLILVACIWIIFSYACGGGGGDGSGSFSDTGSTGSIAFGLAIQPGVQVENDLSAEAANMPRSARAANVPIDCQAYGIATIEVRISDENNNPLAQGGPWDCNLHRGIISNVPVRDNLKLKAFALDDRGNPFLEGETDEPFSVFPGQTTEVGDVELTDNFIPKADAGDDQTAAFRDTVQLDGSGSTDHDGDELIFLWELIRRPEGSSAALSDPSSVKPTFVMDQRGRYEAELVVNDGLAKSDPDTVVIDWINSCPVADAGDDQTIINVGETVQLNGSKSYDVDLDRLNYLWELTEKPEGSSAALINPRLPKPTFIPDVRGKYVAKLTVNDGTCDNKVESEKDRERATVAINVLNTCPVANAGDDQTMRNVGDTIQLDGSGSTDKDSDSLTYSWALTSKPDGSSAVLSDQEDVDPTFIADELGIYVAQLTVNDGTCNSDPSDTVTINVDNTCPTAEAGSDQTMVATGVAVTLDGRGSFDPDPEDTITYRWALISVPPGSRARLFGSTTKAPIFIPDRKGDYVAELIVNDGTCDTDSSPDTVDTVTINAINSCPVAEAGPPQTGKKSGDTITLDGSGSFDPDPEDTITFLWALIRRPEGSKASLSDPTAEKPTFIADRKGDYVAQLIVNDGTCDSDRPDTVTIEVDNTCPEADAGPDQNDIKIDDTVTLDGSGSSDPDSDLLTFSWSLSVPEGSRASLSDKTAEQPTFTADEAGTYVAQLIVNDGTCDSDPPDTVTITVAPNPECEGATCETFKPCDPAGGCVNPVCATIVEGGGVCVEGNTPCAGALDCKSSSDCPGGGLCLRDTCCRRNVCAPPEVWCVNIPEPELESLPAIDLRPTFGGD